MLERSVGGRYGGHVLSLEQEVAAEEADELAAALACGIRAGRRTEGAVDIGAAGGETGAARGEEGANCAAESGLGGLGLSESGLGGADSAIWDFMNDGVDAGHEERHIGAILGSSALGNAGGPDANEPVTEQSIYASMNALDELWKRRKKRGDGGGIGGGATAS